MFNNRSDVAQPVQRVFMTLLAVLSVWVLTAACGTGHPNRPMTKVSPDSPRLQSQSVIEAKASSGGTPARELSRDESSIDNALSAVALAQAQSKSPPPKNPPPANNPPKIARVVIYQATFVITTKDLQGSFGDFEALAKKYDGYIDSIQQNRIVFRVPAKRYEAAVDELEANFEVVDRNLEALDVTEEYVDLMARLRNGERVRDRLNALLEKTQNVTEALEVERELKRINEEIERLKGKLQVIKDRVAFSTITVVFKYVQPPQVTFRPNGVLPFEWLRRLDPISLLEGRR